MTITMIGYFFNLVYLHGRLYSPKTALFGRPYYCHTLKKGLTSSVKPLTTVTTTPGHQRLHAKVKYKNYYHKLYDDTYDFEFLRL